MSKGVFQRGLLTALITALITALMSGVLAGCGSSMKPAGASGQPSSTADVGTNGGSSTGSPTVDDAEWQALDMDGQLGKGGFAGSQVLRLDKEKKELVLILPLPANPHMDGITLSYPIQKLPGASVSLGPINGGGSAMAVHIPLQYLMKKVDFLAPTRLPNGDSLPGFAAGEMPAMALQLAQIKNVNTILYLDVGAIGLFVSTPFDPMIAIGFPIMSKDKTRQWGTLSTVPAKGSVNGGFFMSVQIPDDIARIIDDYI